MVLRYAFDLSEKDTALSLGISVGTVKSQTSKGLAELQRQLGTSRAAGPPGVPLRVHAALGAVSGPGPAPGPGRGTGGGGRTTR